MTKSDDQEPKPPDLLYVSWGGTGRGAAFRRAYDRAAEEDRRIVYLAILDEDTFGDCEAPELHLVVEELTWLLEAQVRLVDREDRTTEVTTRIEVAIGAVVDTVGDAVERLGADLVLVGAPVPLVHHESVEALGRVLAERTGASVELIEPGAP
ncbi:MAG: universal stress protein [Acidimicrobiales bacterium]|nr:universal stress protein [Acidimicrobiales bacterium]